MTPSVATAAEQTDTGVIAGPAADLPEGTPVEVVEDVPSGTEGDAAHYEPRHGKD